jgi:hypothetical protein
MEHDRLTPRPLARHQPGRIRTKRRERGKEARRDEGNVASIPAARAVSGRKGRMRREEEWSLRKAKRGISSSTAP